MAGGLEPDDLQGPFQPLPFYDSTRKGPEGENKKDNSYQLRVCVQKKRAVDKCLCITVEITADSSSCKK